MDKMFDIVARVDLYPEFVPWCKEARVFKRRPGAFKCSLTVGFGPLQEKYTSVVTVAKPHLVKVSIRHVLSSK